MVFLILVGSFCIHFYGLGSNPLNYSEASLGLGSLQLSRGNSIQQMFQPLYTSFTSFLFLFSASDFSARFLPALIGSILPLIPFLYKKWTGSYFSFILSIILIFDPVIIAASRQADSRILALFFGAIFFALIFHSKYLLAGISAGLFFLSGSYSWNLIVVFSLSVAILFLIDKKRDNAIWEKKVVQTIRRGSKSIILGFPLTILLVGTGFFRQLILLNALTNDFLEFITGWMENGFIFNKAILLLVIFIFSYLLPLILNLLGMISLRRIITGLDLFFIIYFASSLLFVLLNPSSIPTDLFFILPAFYYFVTKGIMIWWSFIQTNKTESVLVSVPIICLFGFLWLAILRTLNLPSGSFEFAQMLIAIVGGLFLIGLIALLISWGWSIKIALSGLCVGFFAILLLFQMSTGFHALGISPRPELEIWWNSEFLVNSDSIKNTIEDVSIWNSGIRNGLDVKIEGIKSPGLQWLLRDQKTQIVDHLSSDETISIILTKESSQPILEKTYRGQKFSLYARPLWMNNPQQALDSMDFYRWLFLRDAVIEETDLYLWVRSDLFTGNNIKFES